jgi:hypothetical protein
MELTKKLKMVRLTEGELIGGFVTAKKNLYYIVLNRKDEDGKRRPLWISTELEAIEENKEEAESKCLSARIQYSVDLKNGVAEMPTAKSKKSIAEKDEADIPVEQGRNPLFADLLNEWIAFRHPSNIVVGEDFNFDKQIKLNTWAGYADNI